MADQNELLARRLWQQQKRESGRLRRLERRLVRGSFGQPGDPARAFYVVEERGTAVSRLIVKDGELRLEKVRNGS